MLNRIYTLVFLSGPYYSFSLWVYSAQICAFRPVRLLSVCFFPDSVLTCFCGLLPCWQNGQTPLMLAAEQGSLEIVQELIRRGANVNLDDVVSKSKALRRQLLR